MALDTKTFSAVLQGALAQVQGIKDEALKTLVTEYAPRLEALVTSDDPEGQYADIMVNLHLIGDVLGVEAETVPFAAAGAALRTAAGFALTAAVAA